MLTSIRTCRWIGVTACVLSFLLLRADPARAEEKFRPESVGVRGGIAANYSGRDFEQAEIFGNWNLPWSLDLGKEWHLQSRLDLSVGWLGDSRVNAAIVQLGPSLVLNRERFPLSMEGGVSPTVLSEHAFTAKNFGTLVQFTSHVGVNWDFSPHWRLSYRFQHMSNAGLDSHNPGLNMHLLGLSYRF